MKIRILTLLGGFLWFTSVSLVNSAQLCLEADDHSRVTAAGGSITEIIYFLKSDEKLDSLFKSLKEINSKLWVIEDNKRLCEKNSDFGEKFIKLSRDVHFFNDDRAKIKLEINNHTGSKIKEIKEYTSY